MNHAKLETYRIFDASIVPVCTGGLRVPDSGFRAAFAAKSGGHAARQLGRPAKVAALREKWLRGSGRDNRTRAYHTR